MEKPANLSNKVLQCIQKRRSCRKFTAQAVEDYKVESLLKAALWAPTSKNNRPWHFVVVDNPQLLGKLSECKPHGSAFLAEADRKSTRLNSSHVRISYAVFCLKKKRLQQP